MAEKDKQSIRAGNGSVVVGGNVIGGNIVVGNHNTVSSQSVNVASLFDHLYDLVDRQARLKQEEKADVKAELKDVQAALEAPEPDESFLMRRFRSIKAMAPEIVEVAFETLKNPLGGVAEVIKRVAKKMAE